MSGLQPGDVLFIGLGQSAPCWYRCALPAMFTGNDWVGLTGEPPKVGYATGLVRGQTIIPKTDDYRVVVIQQPRGHGWASLIRGLQSKGVKVVYEVDDYLHGIRKLGDEHDWSQNFRKKDLELLELCMRQSDAILCSTEFIARRYRRFNPRTLVARNGVDPGRYRLTRPARDVVNVGWSGATGHGRAVAPWLQKVADVMGERDDVNFVSIGMEYADALAPHFPPNRYVSVPWTLIDQYPAAMTLMDVALAPAGSSAFYQGKSDLRWLEAAMLGIPTIADPMVYPDVEDGRTGLHASTPDEMRAQLERLVDDPELRLQLGEAARAEVLASRTMEHMAREWLSALDEVVNDG